MNIIYPIKKKYADLIFDKTKPFEFRNKIPKDIKNGDTIYVYETKDKGCGKIVGHFTIGEIKPINHGVGVATYLLMDEYAERYCDEETTRLVKKAKSIVFDECREGLVCSYLFFEKCLDEMLKTRKAPMLDIIRMNDIEFKEYQKTKNRQWKFLDDCDKWLTQIGFYNDYDECSWKYQIEILNPIKYDKPKNIDEFNSKNGKPITIAPQSFCYTTN